MKLNFISDVEFRKLLENDIKELESCLKINAIKSVMILSGSIIEAVLIDFLIGLEVDGFDRKRLLTWSLNDAIVKLHELKMISNKVKDLSNVVRNYRNLIHPGRSIRLDEVPTIDDASVAQALVNMVIDEISQKKQDTYGYTAEQILNKVENDSTSEVIWHHLIKNINNYEKERLLVNVIPKRMFEIFNEYDMDDEVVPSHLYENFSNFFIAIYNTSDEITKKQAAIKFVKIIREGSQKEVIEYIDLFFLIDYFRFFENDDSIMIKQHLLSRLSKELYSYLVSSCRGITNFLNDEDLTLFTNILLRKILNDQNEEDSAKDFLNLEYIDLPVEKQTIIQNIIDQKIEYASEERKEVLLNLKEYIKYDLPF